MFTRNNDFFKSVLKKSLFFVQISVNANLKDERKNTIHNVKNFEHTFEIIAITTNEPPGPSV